VTNPDRLAPRHDERTANSLLVKLNQIGSVDRDPERGGARVPQRFSLRNQSPIWRDGRHHESRSRGSHATAADQTGAPARFRAGSKYNQLLRIEKLLAKEAYAGKAVFPALHRRRRMTSPADPRSPAQRTGQVQPAGPPFSRW